MAQSAVQWLEKHLKDFPHIKHSQSFKDIIEQAKEMEKEQLNVARLEGINLANKGYGKEDKTFKRKSQWTKVNKDQD